MLTNLVRQSLRQAQLLAMKDKAPRTIDKLVQVIGSDAVMFAVLYVYEHAQCRSHKHTHTLFHATHTHKLEFSFSFHTLTPTPTGNQTRQFNTVYYARNGRQDRGMDRRFITGTHLAPRSLARFLFTRICRECVYVLTN